MNATDIPKPTPTSKEDAFWMRELAKIVEQNQNDIQELKNTVNNLVRAING